MMGIDINLLHLAAHGSISEDRGLDSPPASPDGNPVVWICIGETWGVFTLGDTRK